MEEGGLKSPLLTSAKKPDESSDLLFLDDIHSKLSSILESPGIDTVGRCADLIRQIIQRDGRRDQATGVLTEPKFQNLSAALFF